MGRRLVTVSSYLRSLWKFVSKLLELAVKNVQLDHPKSHLQVWYVFSGNGSQWSQMGLSLLKSNVTYQASIRASANWALKHGIDLLSEFHVENGFKDTARSALGLAAVQIAMVDLLRLDYGIVPDGILGHSAGARPSGNLFVKLETSLCNPLLSVFNSVPCRRIWSFKLVQQQIGWCASCTLNLSNLRAKQTACKVSKRSTRHWFVRWEMVNPHAGEIACGYASGCLTRDQTLEVAYHRGRLPVQHGLKGGLMIATGLGVTDAEARVQGSNCVVACDNSPSSTTISGEFVRWQPPQFHVQHSCMLPWLILSETSGKLLPCWGQDREDTLCISSAMSSRDRDPCIASTGALDLRLIHPSLTILRGACNEWEEHAWMLPNKQFLFCVVGPAAEMEKLIVALEKEDIFVRRVDTLGVAFHSAALDPLLHELREGEHSSSTWKHGCAMLYWVLRCESTPASVKRFLACGSSCHHLKAHWNSLCCFEALSWLLCFFLW